MNHLLKYPIGRRFITRHRVEVKIAKHYSEDVIVTEPPGYNESGSKSIGHWASCGMIENNQPSDWDLVAIHKDDHIFSIPALNSDGWYIFYSGIKGRNYYLSTEGHLVSSDSKFLYFKTEQEANKAIFDFDEENINNLLKLEKD